MAWQGWFANVARVQARGDFRERLARSLDLGREWARGGISRLARAADRFGTLDAAAGAVRTVASAAQLATGPVVGLVIGAVSDAAIAAIASHAAVCAIGDAPPEERARALACVIARIEEERLCDPLLASAWRLAIGARRGAFRAEWAVGAVCVAAGAAVARAVRKKKTFAKFLRVATVVEIAHVAERVRRAHQLVARARHHARAFADGTARVRRMSRSDDSPVSAPKSSALRRCVAGVVVASKPLLEVPDPFAEALAQRGHARAPEEQERHEEDQKQMRRLQLAHARETGSATALFPHATPPGVLPT